MKTQQLSMIALLFWLGTFSDAVGQFGAPAAKSDDADIDTLIRALDAGVGRGAESGVHREALHRR